MNPEDQLLLILVFLVAMDLARGISIHRGVKRSADAEPVGSQFPSESRKPADFKTRLS